MTITQSTSSRTKTNECDSIYCSNRQVEERISQSIIHDDFYKEIDCTCQRANKQIDNQQTVTNKNSNDNPDLGCGA